MPTPSDQVHIRAVRAGDFASIGQVVAAAFESEAEADLVEGIRASQNYVPELELVAEFEGQMVGHVMISRCTLRTDGGDRPIVMLSPLAVAPAHQGAGIGSRLVRSVCEAANRLGEPMVVLEGSPAYYRRFGFEHSLEHGIELPLPDWAPATAAQVLRLDSYDTTLRGKVVYPPAFDLVSE